MPRIAGESLAGRKVVFPEATEGHVAVLVFGFTKASKGPTSEWADKISSDLSSQPEFELYQLPVLEGVPRLLRGMVISGIKKGVNERVRDHFVPIVQGEASLKRLVSYREADDAYLVILDRSGKIAGQMHGMYSEESYKEVLVRVRRLLK